MENDEILELIKLDKKVQQNLINRHEEKHSLKQKIENEKKEISDKSWEEIHLKVTLAKKELDEKIKKENTFNIEYLNNHVAELESVFSENYQKWFNEIFKRCIR